jgi:hypothetical protein
MKHTTILFASLLSAVPFVAGHGFVMNQTIASQSYDGNFPDYPNGPTFDSGIRQISTQDPVKGATNAYINCGQDAQNGSLVLSANPGDALTFNWRGADESWVSTILVLIHVVYQFCGFGNQWPHNTGMSQEFVLLTQDS